MTDPAVPQLACPLCRSMEFDKEVGRPTGRWGFTSHRVTMLIPRRCRHVLHFYDARSIFDFA